MTGPLGDVAILRALGREPIASDPLAADPAGFDPLVGFVRGRRVLVTGAGGSIGAELARQVAGLAAAELVLLERSEAALFAIDRELRSGWPAAGGAPSIVPVVGDATDVGRMRRLFEDRRPELVLHAAAHKHVPLMEANAGEAIRNNVFGTRVVAELAGEFGARSFVLVSTDKAVRPRSVMGASKRLAEIVVQDLDRRHPTSYSAVRFGNVIGSAGSVVPIFREQIAAGGPVTVTHRDMTRYFMTIPEASHLVLRAGAMGQGGEIFILDMGAPVAIIELAVTMIRLAGLRPGVDIEIAFTGLRPGEKLAEELTLASEDLRPTAHPRIRIGRLVSYPPEDVVKAMRRLAAVIADDREAELRALLNELIPEGRVELGAGPGPAAGEPV